MSREEVKTFSGDKDINDEFNILRTQYLIDHRQTLSETISNDANLKRQETKLSNLISINENEPIRNISKEDIFKYYKYDKSSESKKYLLGGLPLDIAKLI